MTYFGAHIVLPKKFKPDEIYKEIEESLREEEKKVHDLYKKTVRTWSRRPGFIIKRKRGEDLDILVEADKTKGGDIHRYLDGGTSTRKAVMVSTYSRKSRVRNVGSWPGYGKRTPAYFVQVSQKSDGITAREWSIVISERRSGPLQYNMRVAINRGAQRIF